MSNVREFKYLVGFNRDTNQFQIGHTRTWKFHADILEEFDKGFEPFSAGYFRTELDGFDWVVDAVEIYGKSDGFRIGPNPRDLDMLKKMLQGENDGDQVCWFDAEGNSVDDSTLQNR